MKYVFFGSPRFAAVVFSGLIGAGTVPAAVICNPDRPVGRKKILTPPPVKEIASAHGIAVLQSEHFDDGFLTQIKKIAPEYFVVAAYAKIIPQSVLDLASGGTLGVHPSLLPKYRGASPIQGALLARERETGVSIYLIDDKMDHGPVLKQQAIPIMHENYPELEEKLARLGGALAAEALGKYDAGKIVPQAQDEELATFTKKFKTEDAFVDEKDLAAAQEGDTELSSTIDAKVRAFTSEPGAWTIQKGKRVKLLEAKIEHGKLILLKIQEEGGVPKAV